MIKIKNLKQPNYLIGLLISLIYILASCGEKQKAESNNKITYISAIDSVNYNFQSDSWKGRNSNYSENRFGQNMFIDSSGFFSYVSIDSENELHTFNFQTNKHTYSKPICNYKLDAYKIDTSLIYLLYNNIFYIKDHELNTVDSFVYKHPNIKQTHAIDFTVESSSNLFKIKNYFVLMYYIVDKSGVYRNSKYLFHYFNKEESFFADKVCDELDTSFQYFRYPVVTSDNNFLYHSPRVMNCVSKSNEMKTVAHEPIDRSKNKYLSLTHDGQFQMSKLKKYRFSTHYNKEIISSGDNIYLLREFPEKIYYKNHIQVYLHNLELIKFDKKLNRIRSFYIKDHSYSYAFINGNKLYLFNFQKNKYYIYEI